jgi:putative transposase
VRKVFEVSERRACKVLLQSRTSQRRVPREREADTVLMEKMKALSLEKPRYGYRMIWGLLVNDGWRVNRKRVYRLWKAAGLKIRRSERKRPRPGSGENACHRRRPEYPNHVWSYDITIDATADGRNLKFLVVVDEYTRRCFRIEVGRSMTARQVVRVLKELVRVHGEPTAIRSDNGPEFIAKAVKEWLAERSVETLYIEPGSPWQNGYIESFNSRFEHEFLSQEIFGSVAEAQVLAEHYRLEYNHVRPHSSLGYRTPAQYTEEWTPASAPTALRPASTPMAGRDHTAAHAALP